MKKESPEFDFQSFVKDFSKMSTEEMMALAGTSISERFNQFCVDCEKVGIEEMKRMFTNEEVDFVMSMAISNAMDVATADNTTESLMMTMLAVKSDAINHMFYSMFLFALGLSIKEEIR